VPITNPIAFITPSDLSGNFSEALELIKAAPAPRLKQLLLDMMHNNPVAYSASLILFTLPIMTQLAKDPGVFNGTLAELILDGHGVATHNQATYDQAFNEAQRWFRQMVYNFGVHNQFDPNFEVNYQGQRMPLSAAVVTLGQQLEAQPEVVNGSVNASLIAKKSLVSEWTLLFKTIPLSRPAFADHKLAVSAQALTSMAPVYAKPKSEAEAKEPVLNLLGSFTKA
jgi:hypothetical protein